MQQSLASTSASSGEPYREAIRRQALDAHLALADALAQTGQPAEALPVLQAAIKHDPYAEPVYAQAMRVHAALGEPDAIRALRRELTRRLEEIDSEPSPRPSRSPTSSLPIWNAAPDDHPQQPGDRLEQRDPSDFAESSALTRALW